MTNLLFVLALLVTSKCLEVKIDGVKIYLNGTLDSRFNFTYPKRTSDCSNSKRMYFETSYKNMNNFEIITDDNSSVIQNISIFTTSKFVETQLYVNETKGGTNTNITFFHFCNKELVEKERDKWSEIGITFNYQQKPHSIKFLKICGTPSKIEGIMSGVLIFILGTALVYSACKKDIKIESDDLKDQGSLSLFHGLFFLVLASSILVFIYFFKDYARLILTLIVSVQCIAAVFLTTKTYLDDFIFFRDCTILKAKIMKNFIVEDVIIVIFGLNIVLYYLINRHWILNDLLGYCLCFTALSVLHINTFKACCVILSLTFLYDVFWVFLSPKIFRGNVMETAALSLDLPIKLELPIIFNSNPIKECIYLGLGDLIIPGLLIKFCNTLDKVKGLNIYFISSLIFYFVGLLICGAMLVGFQTAQPALFYVCPCLIFGTTSVAISRGHLEEIWKGEHNPSQSKMNAAHQIDDIFDGTEGDNNAIEIADVQRT